MFFKIFLLSLFISLGCSATLDPEEISWVKGKLFEWDLKRKLKGIGDFKTEVAGEKKTSYGSENLRLKFEKEDEYKKNFSLVLTRLPSTPYRNKQINATGMFKTEIKFYKNVVPLLENLMSKFWDQSSPTWPKPYGFDDESYSSFLVEDIELQRGFKKADRLKGLDLKESLLTLASLAKFHAMTAVIGKEKFNDFDLSLLERNKEKIKNFYQVVFDNLASSIEEKWGPEWVESAKRIREKSKTVTQDLLEMTKRDDNKFNVLNHGSPSLYNIYFSYGNSDVYVSPDPIAVMFDSYQLAFFNSPVMDLQFFMNTSPQIEIMLENKEEMIKTYSESLKRYLEKFNYQGKIPSLEEINEEFKRTEFIGFVHAVNHLPLIYTKTEEIPDLEKTIEEIKKIKKIVVFNKGMLGEKYVKNMKLILKRALDNNVI